MATEDAGYGGYIYGASDEGPTKVDYSFANRSDKVDTIWNALRSLFIGYGTPSEQKPESTPWPVKYTPAPQSQFPVPMRSGSYTQGESITPNEAWSMAMGEQAGVPERLAGQGAYSAGEEGPVKDVVPMDNGEYATPEAGKMPEKGKDNSNLWAGLAGLGLALAKNREEQTAQQQARLRQAAKDLYAPFTGIQGQEPRTTSQFGSILNTIAHLLWIGQNLKAAESPDLNKSQPVNQETTVTKTTYSPWRGEHG